MNFDEDTDILGKIEDVFGNILSPHYIVLTDDYIENFILDKTLKTGTRIYYAPNLAKLIISKKLEKLKKEKAYDA